MTSYSIVLVENDEDEAIFMKAEFDASKAFDVLAVVTNGDALFEWLDSHRDALPDLILTDLNMHGKNGYEILADMAEHPLYAGIPVVITSTSDLQPVVDRCMSLGAAAYLVKPDTFLEYKPFVQELLRTMRGRSA